MRPFFRIAALRSLALEEEELRAREFFSVAAARDDVGRRGPVRPAGRERGLGVGVP